MKKIFNEQEICRTVSKLKPNGKVKELRAMGTRRATVSGYFDQSEKLVDEAKALSGKAPGVYMTLNPVKPELLARCNNRAVGYAKNTTSDSDIIHRDWMLVDFDPKRPSGISSTDDEHTAALSLAKECRDYLIGKGWPAPILADSGNGAHLLSRIDLPNDAQSARLIENCLKALALKFGTNAVEVDTTTHNAARLCRLYGTLTAKGDSTEDRPHRLSCIIEVPETVVPVTTEQLQSLAATLPQAPRFERKNYNGHSPDFDLDAWIVAHNLPVVSSGAWDGGGKKFILNPCPWNPEHKNKAAYIVQFSNGAIAAGCHHKSCANKGWHDLRDIYEPGWRDHKQNANDRQTETQPARSEPRKVGSQKEPMEEKELPALRCLSDIKPEKVNWLWYPRIPLGCLTALEGDPGEGKSFLALAIATALSSGHGLPDGQDIGGMTNTLFLTAEDSLSNTIRPRLDAMGADSRRIFAIDEPFQFDAAGLTHFGTLIGATTARLVVVDPITAFLPSGLDIHRANEVRSVLSRLAKIAAENACAILILRHLAKGNTSKAIYRGLGSIDFTAACRSVLLAGHDPDEPQKKAMVQIKTNLGPMADPLGYSISEGQFRWTGETTLTAGRLLAPEGDGAAGAEAKTFLLEVLASGPLPAKDIEAEAEAAGISKVTLRRAKKTLEIRARKDGFQGQWVWELPHQNTASAGLSVVEI